MIENDVELQITDGNKLQSNIVTDKEKGKIYKSDKYNRDIKHKIQCYPDGSFTYTADCIAKSMFPTNIIDDKMTKKLDEVVKILNTYVKYTVNFINL